MLKPFEYILGKFDPDSLNVIDGEINTGTEYNGKCIYKKTYDIQTISSYTPPVGFENIVKVEGMYKRNSDFYPLSIISISNNIIVQWNPIANWDSGYFSVYYTKTGSNSNPMNPFVSAVAIGILAISAILLTKIDPKYIQMAFDYIK